MCSASHPFQIQNASAYKKTKAGLSSGLVNDEASIRRHFGAQKGGAANL
jgi:hypothetical protein